MRDVLPRTELADLLATMTPPIDPTSPEWIALCSALDAYDFAEWVGLGLGEARQQVDAAAMVLIASAAALEHFDGPRQGVGTRPPRARGAPATPTQPNPHICHGHQGRIGGQP
jgi:hypothetical protein